MAGDTTNVTGTPVRRRRRLVFAFALALIALATAPAGAATEQHAFAVGMNYATPVVNVGQGDSLTFPNLD